MLINSVLIKKRSVNTIYLQPSSDRGRPGSKMRGGSTPDYESAKLKVFLPLNLSYSVSCLLSFPPFSLLFSWRVTVRHHLQSDARGVYYTPRTPLLLTHTIYPIPRIFFLRSKVSEKGGFHRCQFKDDCIFCPIPCPCSYPMSFIYPIYLASFL